MANMISQCPSCGGRLNITVLRCPDCGMELHNSFQLSAFDLLSPEQTEFLISFLKLRGKLNSVQEELGISYPTAKKRLEDLLIALGLAEDNGQTEKEEDSLDMSNWDVPQNSYKASDIVKQMLIEQGGRVIVHTARGLPCEIWAASDGTSFHSNKLPPPYRYEVFDVIVELLLSQGGRARKGNGRFKLGEPDCDETTVVGVIGYKYAHKKTGESVLDPVFVLAAVLEWAGIASNERGELVLTASYQETVHAALKNE